MADKDLKSQRGALKTKLTKFNRFISDVANQSKKTEINTRLLRIEPILDEFESLTQQIDEITKTQSEDFDQFEEQFYEVTSRARDLIDTQSITQPSPIPINCSNRNETADIQLKPIELMHFDGSFDKWVSFYNQFISLVDKNSGLSKIKKLYYLKSSLKGEAENIISSLELSENNYGVALQSLKDRYDNKRVIIQKHVRTLMDLPVTNKDSASDLRNLIDAINKHLRSLKSLGQPTDTWDTLLIDVFTFKLDRAAHQEWERSVTGTEMPTMVEFMKFLETRCQMLQVTSINLANKSSVPAKSNHVKKQVFTVAQSTDSCAVCKGTHKVYACDTLKKLQVKDRLEKIKSSKLCFNCLNAGHMTVDCKWTGCKKCGKKHNTLLHIEFKENTQSDSNQSNEMQPGSSGSKFNGLACKAYSAIVSPQSVLSTAVIKLKGKDGQLVQARALLDSGAQSNFITENLAKSLQLPFQQIDIPIETLNQVETRVKYSIQTEILSRCTDYKEDIEFLVLPSICNQLPNEYIDRKTINVPFKKPLADPEFNKPKEVDVLIGVELFFQLLSIGQEKIPGSTALWQKTKLGWVLAGKIGTLNKPYKPIRCMVALDTIHKSISKFWELEELQDKKFMSEEEYKVEKHFNETTTRDPQTGRYTVRLPFNDKISKLGESRKLAERQFYSLERKLAKTPELKSDYVASIRESIQLGHMVPIDERDIKERHCVLPYHIVTKESSTTTKRRLVNNGSFKTSSGISMNDCLMVGAVVQNGSFEITLRFREHQIVLLADIEKMYKQIEIHPDDAQFQLVLWREHENEPLRTYMIPVVLFGSASAPHSATRVLNQLADDERERFPLASQILKRDCYVDDILTGTDTVAQAIQLRDELIGLTKAGGFTLRKWMSNDLRVVQSLPDSLTNIDLLNENSEMKALGIQWDQVRDEIKYKVIDKFDEKITKRTILSNIARLYDPIGLIGPVIVTAKIIMQKLWQSQVEWDEPVPQHIHTAWYNLKDQLSKLNEISFTRKVVIQNAARIEIHGFCDSSEKAYGACVYIRSINNEGEVMTNLLCSKNRVAPLKTVSLPKLELCAALVLSRLIKTVLDATTLKFNEIILWSDSSITLQWISMQPYQLKTFVANRVSEIRELTSTMSWRHVPTLDNTADILSRGLFPIDLVNHTTWQSGPVWLRENTSAWPKNVIQNVPIPELRPTQVIHLVTHKCDLLTKYSSIHKLKRVVAYILRFKHNSRKTKKDRITGQLSINELNHALSVILRTMQSEAFSTDIKQLMKTNNIESNSQLKALSPFIDDKGLIRVGGRLKYSNLSYQKKYPVILPKNHHITELIVRDIHITHLHSGTQATLHAVRAEYWPLNGKNTIKKIIRNCMTCCKANPTDCSYFMGDLPANRVTQARPFLNTGLDYCGPFYVKEKKLRNRGKVKIYACIFVCFTTKAVHIELISDLTTEAFIAGLRRFFARRGLSANLYSDNATNFVGARNEIEAIAKLVQSEAHNDLVKNFLTNKGIHWHFSPPRSPHFGGLWEAAVKSFKFHYYRVVGDKLFTYEELNTYTMEIEAILNSRPITPMSPDPNDLRALTPAHFLIGESLTSLPDINYTDTPINRLSAWEHIQFMKEHFWKRWSKEYLNQLTTRAKWQIKKPEEIQIGSLVLLKEDNTPSLRWPLGRIIEVFPGKDGITRVVSVKTHSGVYKRSITRISPLPTCND